MAEALRQEPGLDVELVNGNRGEFSVLVNGQVVAQKGWIFKPSIHTVLKAVREAEPAEARA